MRRQEEVDREDRIGHQKFKYDEATVNYPDVSEGPEHLRRSLEERDYLDNPPAFNFSEERQKGMAGALQKYSLTTSGSGTDETSTSAWEQYEEPWTGYRRHEGYRPTWSPGGDVQVAKFKSLAKTRK